MLKSYVHDRYLDSEERFEIFTVKAAERPHLLRWKPPHEDETVTSNEEKKKECSRSDAMHNFSDVVPPLTDGCDLPGWRCEGIAPCMNKTSLSEKCSRGSDADHPFQGTLNVGAGSTLFRRESMFPFMCRDAVIPNNNITICSDDRRCWWYYIKQRLSNQPSSDRAAPVVEYEDVSTLVDYDGQCSGIEQRKVTLFSLEYEMKNHPVKIMNATIHWSAMPNYFEPRHSITSTETETRTTSEWIDNHCKYSPSFNGEGERGVGWTFANLKSRFGNVMFRFSDQHGEMLSLNTYAKYITNPEGLSDDSPLGIYDSEFGDDDATRELLAEYSVPKCFSSDLFELAHECDEDGEVQGRPPYRWILIGPTRSGTGMHVDPLWTNAWVTVLQGVKRWILFPPSTPHTMIGMHPDTPQIPSSIWFRDYYDVVTATSWPTCYRPVEVLQYPGETVFVPNGWPHIVLNLELTVAVTHNYASEFGPFRQMMEEVMRDEPEFGDRWIKGLKSHGRSDLIEKAL